MNERLPPKPEIANQHISKFNLVGVTYSYIYAGIVPPDLDRAGFFEYKVSKVRIDWLVYKNVLVVTVPYVLRMFLVEKQRDDQAENMAGSDVEDADDDESRDIGRIGITLMATYRAPDVESLKVEDWLPHMAGTYGFMNTWAYFRAEAQALVVKFGYPQLTLPLVFQELVPKLVSVAMQSSEAPAASPPPVTSVVESPSAGAKENKGPRKRARPRSTKGS